MLFPILETLLHVVWSDFSPLEVRLKGNGTAKSHLIRVAQTSVPVRAAQYLTDPFVTPPTTTVSKHAIPQGAITLAPMTRYRTTVDWPEAPKIVECAGLYNLEAKGTPIKGMRENIVTIPTSAAQRTKRTSK